MKTSCTRLPQQYKRSSTQPHNQKETRYENTTINDEKYNQPTNENHVARRYKHVNPWTKNGNTS
jgi:hypothetical protein